MKRRTFVEAIREDKTVLIVVGIFVSLDLLVWLNEILDLPYLVLGGPRTPFNWREAATNAVMITASGLFVVSALIRHITERKRAEEAFRAEAARTKVLAAVAAPLNAHLDLDTVLNVVCEEAARALNVPAASVTLYEPDREALLLAATFGLPREVQERFKAIPRALYDEYARDMGPLVVVPDVQATPGLPDTGLGAIYNNRTSVAVSLIRKDELVGTLHIHTLGEPCTFDDDELALLKGLADLSALAIANARLFEEVRAGHERLQTLSRQLVEVQEAERRHIARELHDEVGESLTGLKLLLEMSACLPANEFTASLGEAQALVNELMTRVRDLSLELRPAMLDDLGLLPALLWHFDRYTAQTNVRVIFKHTGLEERRFAPEVETAAYRIVQEALTNVARHAGVSDVTVQLRADQDTLGMQIEDQGTGFDPGAVAASATTGLAGMRERAGLLGGQLTVESALGVGTCVTAELPLGGPAEEGQRGDEHDDNRAGG